MIIKLIFKKKLFIAFFIISLFLVIFYFSHHIKSKFDNELHRYLKNQNFYGNFFIKKINWKIALIKVEGDIFENFKILEFKVLNSFEDTSDYDPFVFKKYENDSIDILYEKCGFFIENSVEYDCSIFIKNIGILGNENKDRIFFDKDKKISFPFNEDFDDQKFFLLEDAMNAGIYIYQNNYKNKFSTVTNFDNFFDPVLVKNKNKYYVFATDQNGYLRVFYSDQIKKNNWNETDYSGKINDPNFSRNAGRFIIFEDYILRPSMKNSNFYGEGVILNKIQFDDKNLKILESKELIINLFDNQARFHHLEKINNFSINEYDYYLIDFGLLEKFKLNSVPIEKAYQKW